MYRDTIAVLRTPQTTITTRLQATITLIQGHLAAALRTTRQVPTTTVAVTQSIPVLVVVNITLTIAATRLMFPNVDNFAENV